MVCTCPFSVFNLYRTLIRLFITGMHFVHNRPSNKQQVATTAKQQNNNITNPFLPYSHDKNNNIVKMYI